MGQVFGGVATGAITGDSLQIDALYINNNTIVGTGGLDLTSTTDLSILAGTDAFLGADNFHITAKVKITGLPTSGIGLEAGEIWNDNGNLKISAGS